MKLTFILGRIPALSLAEIHAVFARAGMNVSVLGWSREAVLAEVEGGSDVRGMAAQLGGTVKVAENAVHVSGAPAAGDIRALLPRTERKIFFGVSCYALERGAPSVSPKKLGLALKRLLEEEGKSARFVVSRDDALSAVVVTTNKLLSPRGAEIVVLSARAGAHLGRTIWVQPYGEFAGRDRGRPQRDARAGMLPPKLARMMINVSGVRQGEVLLDPFCGSGTVLQEAALLGIRNLAGYDADAGAVERTRVNLEWLKKSYRMQEFSYTLKLRDAQRLSQGTEGKIDAIVTEPYLGPPLSRAPHADEAGRLKRGIEALYRGALRSFAVILKAGGRLVMAWPVWRVSNRQLVFLDLEGEAVKQGLIPLDPCAFPFHPLPSEEEGYCAHRRSLLYQREDQHVLREIRIFTNDAFIR